MSKILQMGVKDVYFLVKRLGSDCDDYQQYRELTHNSIESILRARKSGLLKKDEGEVVWDVDWFALSQTGIYRLCISDNGVGMSTLDLQNYINTLSSSSGNQSLTENYGVGAKIAAATRNAAGLIYRSWQNGNGILAQLIVDDTAREVGFHRWEVSEGVWEDVLTDIDDSLKPSIISENGVSVTLLGTHEFDHTFLGPKRLQTEYKTWWLFRTLNRRYYELNVPVKVRVFHTWDPENWPKEIGEVKDNSLMRKVFGQKHYLDMYCIEKGTVQLSNAIAYYYIMDAKKGMDQRQFFEVSGHIAALYQNELYEMRVGNTGRKLLQNFGAIFSANRLVVYVEPNKELCKRITTNTARTELVLDGNSLPWMEWADEFRDNLPNSIKDLEFEIAEKSGTSSHSESIRERLKKIRNLFQLTRYKPVSNGNAEAIDETVGNIQKIEGKTNNTKKNKTAVAASNSGRVGNEYLAKRVEENGTPSKIIKSNSPEPDTKWVSILDGTRQQGDIEDRAARYIRGENMLLINSDFRVFSDLISHFCKTYSAINGVEASVKEVVREWCEQQLVEAVMGIRSVQGSKLWNEDHIVTALSEEALTLAVMPRYHTWAAVKRALGRKLGAKEEVME